MRISCCDNYVVNDQLRLVEGIVLKYGDLFVEGVSTNIPQLIWIAENKYTWIPINVQLLNTLSRLVSYGFLPPALTYNNQNIIRNIFDGQERSLDIKALEFRLIIVNNLLYIRGRPKNSLSIISKEMLALCRLFADKSLYLYYQHHQFVKSKRNPTGDEFKSTVLQNYISLCNILAVNKELKVLINENMLLPIFSLIRGCNDPHSLIMDLLRSDIFLAGTLFTVMENIVKSDKSYLNENLRVKLFANSGYLMKLFNYVVNHSKIRTQQLAVKFKKFKKQIEENKQVDLDFITQLKTDLIKVGLN